MPAKRFSVEQIVAKLREAEKHQAQGLTIPQSCKEFIGGPPLEQEAALGGRLDSYSQVGATGYYYDSSSMSWTPARAGDYIVDGQANFNSNGQSNPGAEQVEVFAGSALQSARKDGTTNSSSQGGLFAAKKVAVAASTVIGMCGSAATTSYIIGAVCLRITPVRIA